MKLTLAVLAGLITVIFLSTVTDIIMHSTGVFPPMGQPMAAALWVLAVAYRFVFTFLGGWISARLDPRRGMKAVRILTGLGCLLGLAGVGMAMSKPEMGPAWYAWGVALTGPLASWLGGVFFNRNMKQTEAI
ncbi:MAG: hypothetical protein ABI036_06175 [Fibrobacteria bacterium]